MNLDAKSWKWIFLYLFQFLAGGGHSGEDAQEWHKVDGGGGAEQPEAFFNEEHEAFEARVILLEADVHDDGADDVRDWHAEGLVEIGGFRLALAQSAQKTLDFILRNNR